MMTAVWSVENVPAVAGKVALTVPVAIVTVAGMVNAWEVLESNMDALPDATLDSVTVQVAVAPGARVVGAHDSVPKAGDVDSTFREAVLEPPFSAAVIVAV